MDNDGATQLHRRLTSYRQEVGRVAEMMGRDRSRLAALERSLNGQSIRLRHLENDRDPTGEKLEHHDNWLARLDDALHDIERQLAPPQPQQGMTKVFDRTTGPPAASVDQGTDFPPPDPMVLPLLPKGQVYIENRVRTGLSLFNPTELSREAFQHAISYAPNTTFGIPVNPEVLLWLLSHANYGE